MRPARVADAADMAALLVSQRSFMAPFDPPRGEEFYTVEGQRREFEQLELAALAGTRQRFLIHDAGDLVGWVSVTNIVRGPFRSANLGYAVAREVNGRGIATHAVGEVCRWAFGEAGLHRLEAGTLLDNHGVAAGAGEERVRADRHRPQLPVHRRRVARPRPVPAGGRRVSVTLRPMEPDEYDGSPATEAARVRRPAGRRRRLEPRRRRGPRPTPTSRGAARRPGHAGAAPEVMVDDESGEAVGRLWFAERELHGRAYVYLYDITVLPDARGRGYGRAAMLALEDEARRLGYRRAHG